MRYLKHILYLLFGLVLCAVSIGAIIAFCALILAPVAEWIGGFLDKDVWLGILIVFISALTAGTLFYGAYTWGREVLQKYF